MKEQVLRHDKQCRLCGSDRISAVFRLNDTPLENQFVSHEKKAVQQPVYPLELAICEDCGYVHLPYIINPEISYADYVVYVSEVRAGSRYHHDHSLVIDLGSNEGSTLASFKRLGMRAVGLDPAQGIAIQANESGLTTINDFLTHKVASRILKDHGSASVITANYMYANVDDVLGFTRAVAKLLAPEGIFVVQTGYHPEQMKSRMFDYIYHEHCSYFTVEVLKDVFSACGLELIHAQKTAPKQGSVRIIGQLKDGTRTVDSSVGHIIDEERQRGMRDVETYRQFALEIAAARKQVLDLLRELKSAGKRIVGFGASHSTTTLTYHFELAPFIEYLVDDNVLKQGLYSPGHHLPVYSSEKLYADVPDYVIILAWQHRNTIMEKHQKYLSNNRHWIVPLPHLNILG